MRLHDTYEVPDDQVAEFAAILGQGSFPHHLMLPGVMRDVGRDHIPMRFADLSRFAGGHSHGPGQPHVLGTRNEVWGVFYLDYRVEVSERLSLSQKAKTTWYELGHAADYSILTDADRTAIAAAMHPHGPDAHPAWWEEKDYHGEYFTLPGESFMGVFYELATGKPADLAGFAHQVTPEVIEVTRRILTPELIEPDPTGPSPYFGLWKSKVVHDEHAGIAREIEWATLAAALAFGRRPCRTCRPKEAA